MNIKTMSILKKMNICLNLWMWKGMGNNKDEISKMLVRYIELISGDDKPLYASLIAELMDTRLKKSRLEDELQELREHLNKSTHINNL